jgi:hypothetical protein
MCVVVFAALLPVLGASRAHADGHSVAVTSPAPAMLTAELYTPRGTGPFPTVVLLHGCSGIGPNAVTLRFLGSGDAFGSGGSARCATDHPHPHGRDMLAREREARFERAHDGLVVSL